MNKWLLKYVLPAPRRSVCGDAHVLCYKIQPLGHWGKWGCGGQLNGPPAVCSVAYSQCACAEREKRRDLAMGIGRMLPPANHLCGGEADDSMQSTQLWLDAKHLGAKPSNQVVQIKENLINKYFQCLLCAFGQLWLEWMTFESDSAPQIPRISVPDA